MMGIEEEVVDIKEKVEEVEKETAMIEVEVAVGSSRDNLTEAKWPQNLSSLSNISL